jgi:CubicO group peptidase (beta-lactamase class C family)
MKITRRLSLALGSSAVLMPTFDRLAAALPSEPDRSAIEAAGKSAVAAGTTAGLAIGLARRGRITAGAYGFANLETATPAATDSIFRIASITKTFTATAIMLLRDRGKLRLNQPLSDFFPAIASASQITLYQLLSHTSGLHDYVRGGLPKAAEAWRTPDEFAAGVAGMDPLRDFDPGTRYSYSNSGYILLGGVIEKVSGLSYQAFLDRNIFQPCAIRRTAVDRFEEVVVGRADGYALDGSKAGAFSHVNLMGLPFSAGALRSTLLDLLSWTHCFFTGRVVAPATVGEMIVPARVASGARTGDARWWPHGFDPGQPPAFARDNHYGLGWEMTTFFGQRTIGHSGGISGYNSLLLHYPDHDLTLALLANTENGVIAPFQQLAARIGKGEIGR